MRRRTTAPPRSRRRPGLAALVAALLLPALPAAAAQISALVAERATQEVGPGMPDKGFFNVRMAEGLPDQGDFIREFWIDRDNRLHDRREFLRANVDADWSDTLLYP